MVENRQSRSHAQYSKTYAALQRNIFKFYLAAGETIGL
jgi:hypothetical protein